MKQEPTESATGAGRNLWPSGRRGRQKCPKTIDVVEALPLGATGKILKRELRDRYAADSTGV